MKMRVFNHYMTPNYKILEQRSMEYTNENYGIFKDFRLNHAGDLKELPAYVLILTDYVDQITLRKQEINSEIYLHSIYIKHPELFEY